MLCAGLFKKHFDSTYLSSQFHIEKSHAHSIPGVFFGREKKYILFSLRNIFSVRQLQQRNERRSTCVTGNDIERALHSGSLDCKSAETSPPPISERCGTNGSRVRYGKSAAIDKVRERKRNKIHRMAGLKLRSPDSSHPCLAVSLIEKDRRRDRNGRGRSNIGHFHLSVRRYKSGNGTCLSRLSTPRRFFLFSRFILRTDGIGFLPVQRREDVILFSGSGSNRFQKRWRQRHEGWGGTGSLIELDQFMGG